MIRLLPLLLATPLAAEPWSCAFTAECIVGASCDATDWSVEIIAADHEGQLFLSSITGDDAVTRQTDEGALPAAYAAPDRLITISADGTATLTAHLSQTVTYFGTCEVLE